MPPLSAPGTKLIEAERVLLGERRARQAGVLPLGQHALARLPAIGVGYTDSFNKSHGGISVVDRRRRG